MTNSGITFVILLADVHANQFDVSDFKVPAGVITPCYANARGTALSAIYGTTVSFWVRRRGYRGRNGSVPGGACVRPVILGDTVSPA